MRMIGADDVNIFYIQLVHIIVGILLSITLILIAGFSLGKKILNFKFWIQCANFLT
jgi:hypothetical protein